jgi:CDP-2,3-bis-(O-geranylgeranyl)-sn-glycerol synthase
VLARDLLPTLKRPLDGGRTWRGRRLLGDNKTWRGALFMSAGSFGAAVALHRTARYRRRLPAPLQAAHPAAFGAAIAAGVVGGELPNSFLKRRLDLAPGTQRGGATGAALTVLDQGDLVLGIWAALAPLWRMPARDALDAFVLVSAIHAGVNVVGYRIGARSAPV